MNQQIKQLAEQAGSTHKQNLGVYQFYESELVEFAKGVIDQCVHAVHHTNINHAGTTYDRQMAEATVERSVKAIHDKFKETHYAI